jgi:hypothetical protein
MIQIPANLKHLAKIASDPEYVNRHRTDCIRLSVTPTGYRAEATDGRTAIIVEGRCKLGLAPTDLAGGLIPAATLAMALDCVPTGLARPDHKLAQVIFGEKGATITVNAVGTVGVFAIFAVPAPDPAGNRLPEVPRFPPIDDVVPKDTPLAVAVFDAKRLASLLAIVAEFENDNGFSKVTLELRGPDTPAVLRWQCGDQKFLAMVMPMIKKEGE